MRRFLRQNEMRAAYWKQTCFFFLALILFCALPEFPKNC